MLSGDIIASVNGNQLNKLLGQEGEVARVSSRGLGLVLN